MFNDSRALHDSVRSMLQLWRERIRTKNSLKEEWEEMIIHTRRLIQETANVEDNLFPKINSKFNNSTEIISAYEKTLNNMMPQVKVHNYYL